MFSNRGACQKKKTPKTNDNTAMGWVKIGQVGSENGAWLKVKRRSSRGKPNLILAVRNVLIVTQKRMKIGSWLSNTLQPVLVWVVPDRFMLPGSDQSLCVSNFCSFRVCFGACEKKKSK